MRCFTFLLPKTTHIFGDINTCFINYRNKPKTPCTEVFSPLYINIVALSTIHRLNSHGDRDNYMGSDGSMVSEHCRVQQHLKLNM